MSEVEPAEPEVPQDPVERFFERTDESGLERLRRRDAGDYNLVESMEYVSAIRKMALAARDQDPMLVPDEWHERWRKQIVALDETLRTAEQFSAKEHNDPNAAFREITERIKSDRDWFAREIKPHVNAPEVELGVLSAQTIEHAEKAASAAEEITTLLSGLRAESGKAGAETLFGYYAAQAKEHKDAADENQDRTIYALAAFLVLIVGLFWWPLAHDVPAPGAPGSEDRWESFIRGLAPRLLLLGIAAYALAFFARNYKVEKHLQAVNEHKRNALRTYIKFLEAIGNDDDQRNLVTAELVRRVFENVDTGYIAATGDKTVVETAPNLLSALRPP